MYAQGMFHYCIVRMAFYKASMLSLQNDCNTANPIDTLPCKPNSPAFWRLLNYCIFDSKLAGCPHFPQDLKMIALAKKTNDSFIMKLAYKYIINIAC